eukprot:gene3485-4480_t
MFSYPELAFGCLLACLIIITAVTVFMNVCKPLLEVFDKIPLFVIIT